MKQENARKKELLSSSEFVSAVDSFARYASEEWVRGNGDNRAILIGCVDALASDDGTVVVCASAGAPSLLTAAVSSMMRSEDLGGVFNEARILSGCAPDTEKQEKEERRRLRTSYMQAAVSALWTLFLVVYWAIGLSNWLTTLSSVLLMAVCIMLLWRDISARRRQLEELRSLRRREAEDMAASAAGMLRRVMRGNRDEDDENDL